MAEIKPSTILYICLTTTLLVSIVLIMISSSVNTYSFTYDQTRLNQFQRLNATYAVAQNISISAQSIQTSNSIFDIFGNLFGQIWNSIKLLGTSITGMSDVANLALENVPAGQSLNIIRIFFGAVFLIAFAFMLIKYIIKDKV